MTTRAINRLLLVLLSLASVPVARGAAPTILPSVFADHMVLQRDLPIPVWGRAEPGAKISVRAADSQASATADTTGAWSVRLDPLKASATPIELSVSDESGTVATFRDVLVGDVWIASGQSNMEFALRNANKAPDSEPRSDNPTMRLFLVRRRPAQQPQFTCDARWTVCTPDTAAGFSAVAYFFAREIQQTQPNVPIGLIGTYAAGTKAELWMSLDGFFAEPKLHEITDELNRIKANWDALQKRYEAEQIPAWQKAHDQWDHEYGEAYRDALKQWNEASAKARDAGTALPPKPRPTRPEPKRPDPPSTNPHSLGAHWNAMVAPIVPFAIKGVIWYQGESNADNPTRYRALFPALIADWRRKWNQPGDPGSQTRDFPFLFVQLANFVAYPNTDWPALREAQAKTLEISPNTAMAVAIDVGMDNDIHPKDKYTVGHRLALAAKNLVYGKSDIVFAGPTFDEMKVDGNQVRIRFRNTGAGLVTANTPAASSATTEPTTLPSVPVLGFTIAGDDNKFTDATATIVSPDTVLISSPLVGNPKSIRYAWANTPPVNLYNKAGLPAVPFRTDTTPTTLPAEPEPMP